MNYDRPVLNNHLDSRLPNKFTMLNKVKSFGYELNPIKQNNFIVCDVYKNGVWLKTGDIQYDNKDVCVYETLKIFYKKIMRL